MKYYIGRLVVWQEEYESFSDACIVAANDEQAWKLLEQRALLFADAPSAFDEHGHARFEGIETLAVKPQRLYDICVVTFQELSKFMPTFGDVAKGDLTEQEASARVRTLARRIGEHLKKLDTKVAHGKLLHAVAASLGENDWQVLAHKAAPAASAMQDEPTDNAWTANGGTQPFVPGSGYLWRVPVSVDTSMTAIVKVRARDKVEAINLARRFASEGNARFEVDEGNYRGFGDHYVSDDSDDGVYRLPDDEPAVPEHIDENANMAQSGPYKVSLFDLADGDDAMLWADLDVFDPTLEDPDDALEIASCMSACPVSATAQERKRFCQRVADLLNRAAPEPSRLSQRDVQHVFTLAVQGDQSDEAFVALEAKLKAMTR